MRTAIILGFLMLCCTVLLAGDAAEQPFKSVPSVPPLLAKLDQDIDGANKQCEKRISDARAACIASLKRTLEAETKKGNLDGANEVKAKVKALEEEQPKVGVKAMIPAAATRFGKHSYLAVTMIGVTWEQAREMCQKMGGDLVVIDSKEEAKFIVGLCSTRTQIWIGGQKVGDQWKWVDGKAVDRSSWAPNFPNPRVGDDYMLLGGLGLWANEVGPNSNPREVVWGFVCEWPSE